MNQKEKKIFKQLWEVTYVTVDGRMSIGEMIERYGNPHIVLNVSRFEASAGSKPIIVERAIDAELHFRKDIVVRHMPKKFALGLDANGIEKQYIRMPNYNPARPPSARPQEIREHEKKEDAQGQE